MNKPARQLVLSTQPFWLPVMMSQPLMVNHVPDDRNADEAEVHRVWLGFHGAFVLAETVLNTTPVFPRCFPRPVPVRLLVDTLNYMAAVNPRAMPSMQPVEKRILDASIRLWERACNLWTEVTQAHKKYMTSGELDATRLDVHQHLTDVNREIMVLRDEFAKGRNELTSPFRTLTGNNANHELYEQIALAAEMVFALSRFMGQWARNFADRSNTGGLMPLYGGGGFSNHAGLNLELRNSAYMLLSNRGMDGDWGEMFACANKVLGALWGTPWQGQPDFGPVFDAVVNCQGVRQAAIAAQLDLSKVPALYQALLDAKCTNRFALETVKRLPKLLAPQAWPWDKSLSWRIGGHWVLTELSGRP